MYSAYNVFRMNLIVCGFSPTLCIACLIINKRIAIMLRHRLPFAVLAALISTAAMAGGAEDKSQPAKPFNNVNQGWIGDGKTLNTKAIQSVIDRTAAEGGGTVVVPKGIFITGAIFLKQGVNLHIEKDGVLKGTADQNEYPLIKSRWEGVETERRAALLTAVDLNGVAVSGEGAIDGSGDEWVRLFNEENVKNGIPPKSKVPVPRPGRPKLICFQNCRNVRISDLNLLNPASWGLHILYSEDVTVQNLKSRAAHNIPNADGIDVDSSRRVRISACDIDANDDCISIKAGRDADGLRVNRPSEDIIVEKCRFGYGHGGVAVGSETSGSIRNVEVRDCTAEDDNWAPIRVKSTASRGGVVENIIFKNIEMRNVRRAFEFNLLYSAANADNPPAKVLVVVRNVRLINVSGDAQNAGIMYGLPESPIRDVKFEYCTISAQKGLEVKSVKDVDFSGLKLIVKDGKPIIQKDTTTIPAPAANSARRDVYAQKSDVWFRTNEAKTIIENVLSWQDNEGAWPKNQDNTAKPFEGEKKDIRGTFDNGATTEEIRFLARAYRATKDQRCLEAVNKAFELLLKAQYPTGGWPQSYPPDNQYHRFITFNDNAMIRLMRLLDDAASSPDFDFLDAQRRAAIKQSFDKGIHCILKCQILVNGRLTVWCAQHDEKDFSPQHGRTYELPSLSGSESRGILELLMDLDNPGPEVIRAVKSGAEWYAASKILGIRLIAVEGDMKIVEDKGAPPLWARFYDIETNRPIFSGRDGTKKFSMAEIEPERRNHYRWYVDDGEKIARTYAMWKEKWLKPAPAEIETEIKSKIEKAGAVVAADGSGKFKSVQEAIDAAPAGSVIPYVIYVKKGIYKGPFTIPAEKRFIHLVGEDWDTTVLSGDLGAKKPGDDGQPIGTFKTASVNINADDFCAENLTFENTYGVGSQALAVHAVGDRGVFKRCRLLGWQDTILINAGRHYFNRCYIAGHVDFIFGAGTAFFEKCVIDCRSKGYVTAASTPEDRKFGFVFSNCRITGESGSGNKTYLGRPWRPFAAVAFLNTEMSEVVQPAGWDNWRNPANEKTARYAEYKSTGPGANPATRVSWSKQLTDEEAKPFALENVLGGKDGWNPK
jgi:pectinesterase